MFLLFNEEKNRFRKRNQFIAIEQNFPTKAVVCVHVFVVGTERLHQFNAPIKSQRHKSINRLGVQLKFRTYVFIYSRCKDAFTHLPSNFMTCVHHVFIHWSVFFATWLSQSNNLRTFERHVSIWVRSFSPSLLSLFIFPLFCRHA